jgi:hypothetical protein
MTDLRHELAPRILPVVLANLTTRYPYHDAHLTREGEAPRDPTVLHPAFGNSFDWHSSVHSHWTALQLLTYFSESSRTAPENIADLRALVAEHLTADPIAAEIAYLREHPSYERPYGWAWAMMLAAANRDAPLLELAQWIAERVVSWLAVLREPVRHGVHSNTAFALGLMLDAAPALELTAWRESIAARARDWFEDDRDWPGQWERSGHDFLSPGLAEADVMRRILPRAAFAAWWQRFVPGLTAGSAMLAAVDVPLVADGQIVHWHGLNLSRAAMLARIAQALDDAALLQQARRLYRASADYAVSGDYLVTHWLATFAWDAAAGIDAAG